MSTIITFTDNGFIVRTYRSVHVIIISLRNIGETVVQLIDAVLDVVRISVVLVLDEVVGLGRLTLADPLPAEALELACNAQGGKLQSLTIRPRVVLACRR